MRLPQEVRSGGLGCGIFKELPPRQISQHRLKALPHNFMIIQVPAVLCCLVAFLLLVGLVELAS